MHFPNIMTPFSTVSEPKPATRLFFAKVKKPVLPYHLRLKELGQQDVKKVKKEENFLNSYDAPLLPNSNYLLGISKTSSNESLSEPSIKTDKKKKTSSKSQSKGPVIPYELLCKWSSRIKSRSTNSSPYQGFSVSSVGKEKLHSKKIPLRRVKSSSFPSNKPSLVPYFQSVDNFESKKSENQLKRQLSLVTKSSPKLRSSLPANFVFLPPILKDENNQGPLNISFNQSNQHLPSDINLDSFFDTTS